MDARKKLNWLDYLRLMRTLPKKSSGQASTAEPVGSIINWEGATDWDIWVRENHLLLAAVRHLRAPVYLEKASVVSTHDTSSLGQHLLAEFHLSSQMNAAIINSPNPANTIHSLLLSAVRLTGATILTEAACFQFANGNITSLVPVQESHFIITYIPDARHVSLDCFTCGEIALEKAWQFLANQWNPSYDQILLKRGMRRNASDNFLQGVAYAKGEQLHFFKQALPNSSSLGNHAIVELHLCDASILNSKDGMADAFITAFEKAGAKSRYSHFYEFNPQGITCVFIGEGPSEDNNFSFFHATAHDWPEYQYVAIDLCTFGNEINQKILLDTLVEMLDAKSVSITNFPRGNYHLKLKMPAVIYGKQMDDGVQLDKPPSRFGCN